MSFDKNQNQKKDTRGARTENARAAVKRARGYKIAAAILAIFVLHFVWQFSFIQRENLRVTEDSLGSARFDVAPVESQPNVTPAEIKTDLTAKKTRVKETVKKVTPVKYSPPESKSPPIEPKKKAAREPKSERLRRAEKLLTGF